MTTGGRATGDRSFRASKNLAVAVAGIVHPPVNRSDDDPGLPPPPTTIVPDKLEGIKFPSPSLALTPSSSPPTRLLASRLSLSLSARILPSSPRIRRTGRTVSRRAWSAVQVRGPACPPPSVDRWEEMRAN
ncbi:hypothetical protein NL676_005915 [Syzygium grande]|nr:hypothetical protein NL676_005915 [Syzygium grande]